MKKHFAILLSAFLIYANFSLAQSKMNRDNEINFVDSAIYYCEQCQNAKGIDTVTFEKAIDMIRQMDLNEHSISQIEKISTDFKKQNKSWFSKIIDEALISKVTRSDSLDLAIRYCKNIINNYDISRNPDDRLTALNALIELRIPLRNKSFPETFDYYTSRLKVYLDKNDSTAIAISYFCLGTTYRLTGLPDMTIYHIKKSLSYINKNDTVTQGRKPGLMVG